MSIEEQLDTYLYLLVLIVLDESLSFDVVKAADFSIWYLGLVYKRLYSVMIMFIEISKSYTHMNEAQINVMEIIISSEKKNVIASCLDANHKSKIIEGCTSWQISWWTST